MNMVMDKGIGDQLVASIIFTDEVQNPCIDN